MQDIVKQYQSYGEEGEVVTIQSAYDYAKKAHTGVLRKSGDQYLVHPVASVQELMTLQPDSTTIIATLLHDVVSHGTGSYKEIKTLFGEEVGIMVEQLDTIRRVKYR
jgi:GTP pyrophosphokinase